MQYSNCNCQIESSPERDYCWHWYINGCFGRPNTWLLCFHWQHLCINWKRTGNKPVTGRHDTSWRQSLTVTFPVSKHFLQLDDNKYFSRQHLHCKLCKTVHHNHTLFTTKFGRNFTVLHFFKLTWTRCGSFGYIEKDSFKNSTEIHVDVVLCRWKIL